MMSLLWPLYIYTHRFILLIKLKKITELLCLFRIAKEKHNINGNFVFIGELV